MRKNAKKLALTHLNIEIFDKLFAYKCDRYIHFNLRKQMTC